MDGAAAAAVDDDDDVEGRPKPSIVQADIATARAMNIVFLVNILTFSVTLSWKPIAAAPQ